MIISNRMAATGCIIGLLTFGPARGQSNVGKAWQYMKVEEGRYENGTFRLLGICNGDETDWGGPHFGALPAVLYVTLISR